MNSKRLKSLLGCAMVPLLALVATSTSATATDEKKPVVSDKPLTAEQLAVYRAVLKSYKSQETGNLNLSIKTVPLENDSAFAGHDCAKGLEMEPLQTDIFHSFKTDDLAQWGNLGLRLVDPIAQSQKIKDNDPGKMIRQGVSVDDAVKNGFANGLFSLSEIWFDKTHQHALVSFGFRCGSLCGNGASVVLVKKNDVWSIQTQCGAWMS